MQNKRNNIWAQNSMHKIITVESGSITLCIDIDDIEKLYTDGGTTQSMLSDLRRSGVKMRDNEDGAEIFSLPLLLGQDGDTTRETQKLVLLKHGDESVAVFVDSVGEIIELPSGSVAELPKAFSSTCVDCFPTVAMSEDRAIPVLTAQSVLALGELQRDR